MKIMKYILCILILKSLLTSCSPYKNIEKRCKSYPYPELDSLQRATQKQDYKIEISNNWEKSRFARGNWYFINDKFIDSLGYYSRKVDLYISQDIIVNKCINYYSVKDYLNYYLYNKNLSLFPKKFNYVLLKSSHKKYGVVYIIKYKENRSNKIFSNSIFFIRYKNNGYKIRYTGLTENFDKYLPDVEKMVSSFTIKE